MAEDTTWIDAPASAIFSVLSDPRRYEQFVVGNSGIRRFDPSWPDDGSEFHHNLGIKPFVIRDKSTCVATDNRGYLVLLTRMGFVGATLTTFGLHSRDEGCMVAIREEPLWGPISWIWSKPVDMVLAWRNRRLLVHLSDLAQQQFERERSVLAAGQQSPTEQGPGQ